MKSFLRLMAQKRFSKFVATSVLSVFLSTGLQAQTAALDTDLASLEQVKLSPDLIIRDAEETGLETGLPMPRYVSLKSNKINLRTGPGFRYPVDWVFQRRMLPVIVVEEFENWRQVRTHDGIIGWLHKNMISGIRTFRIVNETLPLKATPSFGGSDLAMLNIGVVGRINTCDDKWCGVQIESQNHGLIDGWLPKANMFGVGPEEVIR
ncbi:MAG: SH3 domain-containing protein [Alphaproteobacteria bacterium]